LDVDIPYRVFCDGAEEYFSHRSDNEPVPLDELVSYVINLVLTNDDANHTLYSFAMRGDECELRKVVESGADVNQQGAFGWTPLLAATAQGYATIVRVLLTSGANPDLANVNLLTPLHFASRYGNTAVCGLLLEFGANPNLCDKHGQTPLMVAIDRSHPHIANLLLDHGVDASVRDVEGHTALELAELHHFGDIAKRLRFQS
jgi:ankyrin repeat protein